MNSFSSSSALIAAGEFDIGAGRLIPTMAAAVGLVGTVVGALALIRVVRRPELPSRRFDGIVAGAAGAVSLIVGGLHSANAHGGFGTGNGLAGAVVAILLGLVSLILGGLTVLRARLKSASRSSD